MADDKTVAVLGTGIMGAAMARNLLSAGMAVRAWNRSREKAESLAREGAEIADDPADTARGADFILTLLADADAVEEAEEAVGGDVLSALAEDSVWLQMSTVGEGGNERLAGMAADHGVTYVDAPVLGTKQPAEQGQLIVLASGPEEVRERSEQVFGVVGSKTVWLGEAGEGSRLKLVANTWIVGLLGVLAETVAFAEATGVDPAKFLETIEGGPLGLPYAQLKGSMMVEDDFPTSFSANLARKDAALVLDSARDHDLHLRIAEAVTALFDDAIQAGHGEDDMAAIYRAAKPDRG
ncbi:MAG: NAD(P)-dependent oxidoreductase [Actinomycetota bacterium]|nr:NAD(P)-dependent oxidoreductase [Actinomycetota bacterium]MDQ3436410.1 NAD(P)-dependent oxidoreductase [Actinomycetota bacterium]